MNANGLTTIPSSHPPKETLARLKAAASAKGMTVFPRIDHAAGGAKVGFSLRLTIRFRYVRPDEVMSRFQICCSA
jgi:uncharacterized protein (DUF302 family)